MLRGKLGANIIDNLFFGTIMDHAYLEELKPNAKGIGYVIVRAVSN